MVRITFDPDEFEDQIERGAPIPIVDDLVDEATEQVFVVQLHLVNSINPSLVHLTRRPSALCRIVDNDRKLKECDTILVAARQNPMCSCPYHRYQNWI